MEICRIRWIKQQQRAVGLNGVLVASQCFAGLGQVSIGLRDERIDGQEPLGMTLYPIPV